MQHLGLISILLVWAGLLLLVRKWKGNVSMTFSQHAAQTRAARHYYFVLFALHLPLFALFMLVWFGSAYHMPIMFGTILTVGLAAQLLAVAIPETQGWRVSVHRYAALIMTQSLTLLGVIIALNSDVSSFARVIAAGSVCVQLVCSALVIPRMGYHPKALPIQAVFIASFHLTILAATYLR